MKTLQKIAKTANAKRRSDQTYWKFINTLEEKEKTAVIIDNFMNSVEVSIRLWFDNGYYSKEAVDRIAKASPTFKQEMTKKVLDIAIETKDFARNVLEFDNWYKTIKEQYEQDVEHYLTDPETYVIIISIEEEPFEEHIAYAIITEAKSTNDAKQTEKQILKTLEPLHKGKRITSQIKKIETLQEIKKALSSPEQ